ncbi:putative component of viral defense system (DUF524 family) [Caldalkalibacillus uzonensis]|uniref:Component of viral defense system (DUF524 family) n=1 Tax=Caldalkalibacillus uzonensis TaxID=353224 RepID=A0ABU0CQS5_9BACI|nr:restriction endonuclease-like protein [Caldalkalibacillus uzonensis]MDQ0338769.1 putative component of viral defense system (DUF524 family) [Caldalkalibacillus uzonensis]
MVSPHSGWPDQVQDLLHIETEQLVLTIKGRPVHPTVRQLQLHDEENKALLEVYPAEAEVYHFDPRAATEDHLVPYSGPDVYPVFYENQDYELVIQVKDPDLTITFEHDNPSLSKAVSKVRGMDRLWTGHLNFRNEVGYTEFRIRSGKVLLLKVTPSKMDYRRDYMQLLDEVNRTVYNLAYDFLRKTFHTMGLYEGQKPTKAEFFAILETIMDQLVQAVERIELFPQTKLEREERIRPADRVRKASRRNHRWLAKKLHLLQPHQLGMLQIEGQAYHPLRLREERKRPSFDTPENRFLKWMLQQLIRQLNSFEQAYREAFAQRDQNETFLARVERTKQTLRRLVHKPFLAEVGALQHISITLVMQMGTGYRDVYRFYLMLRKGLSIQSDIFRLSPKDLATLYEYWCFLTLHRLLSKKYEVVKNDLIKINDRGLYVTLERAASGKVTYRNPRTGERYQLVYNPLYKDGVVNQRPDHVLSLQKEDSQITYKFVFDAKYRLNPAVPGSDYARKYGQPGPEEDDINTMHRYRDAIIVQDRTDEAHGGGYQRLMYGAYVLFPYRDEGRYRQHPFYRSIDTVNIGGLPFLPGTTSMVEELLDQLITETAEASFERATPVRGMSEFFARKKASLNVLVGSLRRPRQGYDQLSLCLQHRFYHIPLELVQYHLSHIEYVALYQQKHDYPPGGILYYGKVKDFQIVRRREIKELPRRPEREARLYVRFNVQDWEREKSPLNRGGTGCHPIYSPLGNYSTRRWNFLN